MAPQPSDLHSQRPYSDVALLPQALQTSSGRINRAVHTAHRINFTKETTMTQAPYTAYNGERRAKRMSDDWSAATAFTQSPSAADRDFAESAARLLVPCQVPRT